jgi:hypothetical protein
VARPSFCSKLGKYTAYATPVLLATVTAAQAASAPTPAPPQASDARLKINMTPVEALQNGLMLYSYQFRRDPTTTYVGVLAQDLLNSENSRFRDAVIVDADGFYAVKYDELGLKMLTLDEWRVMNEESCRLAEAHLPFVETVIRSLVTTRPMLS